MVLRRYTPPTCTLEITAKTSPLSFWAGQPMLKSLRFELRLDDPRLPEEKHVTLTGDRAQLEALHDAVSTYVQNLLSESSAVDSEQKLKVRSATTETDSILPATQPLVLDESYNPYAIAPDLSESGQPNLRNITAVSSPPRLEPRGLLAHDLWLGELANDLSGSVVHLSVLQLFDLATALDEYAAEVMALPNLKRSRQGNTPPVWLSTAAAVVMAVGLTAGGVLLFKRSGQPETASIQSTAKVPGSVESKTGDRQVASRISPVPTVGIQSATPSPTPTSGKPLLPPPPVGAVSPSAKLPTAIASPSSSVKPSPVVPPTPIFEPPSPPSPEQQQAIFIPGSAAPMPPNPQPQVPVSNPTPIVLRTAPPSPPLKAAPPPPTLRSGSPTAQLPRRDTLPTLEEINPKVSGSTELPPLEDNQPPSPLEEDSKEVAGDRKNHTLFDTIPQVAEARSYFQDRWQPPEDLKATLEYTLQLDANGSIQRIIPLGQAAGDYLDRTSMPLVGEPFVSAVSEGKTPRIRVVLRPNGKVQTFLEALE